MTFFGSRVAGEPASEASVTLPVTQFEIEVESAES